MDKEKQFARLIKELAKEYDVNYFLAIEDDIIIASNNSNNDFIKSLIEKYAKKESKELTFMDLYNYIKIVKVDDYGYHDPFPEEIGYPKLVFHIDKISRIGSEIAKLNWHIIVNICYEKVNSPNNFVPIGVIEFNIDNPNSLNRDSVILYEVNDGKLSGENIELYDINKDIKTIDLSIFGENTSIVIKSFLIRVLDKYKLELI